MHKISLYLETEWQECRGETGAAVFSTRASNVHVWEAVDAGGRSEKLKIIIIILLFCLPAVSSPSPGTRIYMRTDWCARAWQFSSPPRASTAAVDICFSISPTISSHQATCQSPVVVTWLPLATIDLQQQLLIFDTKYTWVQVFASTVGPFYYEVPRNIINIINTSHQVRTHEATRCVYDARPQCGNMVTIYVHTVNCSQQQQQYHWFTGLLVYWYPCCRTVPVETEGCAGTGVYILATRYQVFNNRYTIRPLILALMG